MKRFQPFLVPAFLLGLCVLAYGLWVPRMGWYWDDFPIGWIARTYGDAGLERYFSTNRPFWGLLYRLTTPLLGAHPLAWQVFAIFWRWISGLALWWLIRLAWPRRSDFAAWAAALFLVYPGFSQQFIALVYSHFFIILSAFVGSLALTAYALRNPSRFWAASALAWFLGLVNLLCMEYWFFLELLRPLLIYLILRDGGSLPLRRAPRPTTPTGDATPAEAQLRRHLLDAEQRQAPLRVWGVALLAWLPYLFNLAGVIVWRTFFFKPATYETVFGSLLRADPAGTLLRLLGRIARDIWFTSGLVWKNAFRLPTHEELTPNLMLIFWGVVAAGAIFCLAFAWMTRDRVRETDESRRWFTAPLLVGLVALVVGGVPYWMINLPLELTFHFDRFNLSYMPGAALVVVGLLHLAPLPRWLRVLPLAVALGFCAGYQYQRAIVYVRDWNVQQRMFWQLAWRMPALEPGTVLLSNELPMRHYSDNSLTAPLNWVFAPDNRSLQMSYALYYPTIRVGTNIPALQPGIELRWDYLAAEYQGNTSLAVAFYYNPPGCVRVLDPQIEAGNYTLPRYLREAMVLSSTAPILPEGEPSLPAALFGVQSESSWCYYFEKADLARQLGDWQRVVELGEAGFASGDYPNDPTERFPFIEAYAHTGDWQRALEQTRLAASIAPVYELSVCRLWERIEKQTRPGAERNAAVQSVLDGYRCDEPRQEPVQEQPQEAKP